LPLTDQDIANVLTYVYNSFGNSGLDVTDAEVAATRRQNVSPSIASAPARPARALPPPSPFE
jgi:hypothetical protein